jgi:DNA invertase Pin-like site-specific DNA recombinase
MTLDAGKDAIYEQARRNEARQILDTGMLVTQSDAAALLGITKSTLSWRGRQGYAPQPIGRIGKSLLYWLPDVTGEALRRMGVQ